MSPEIPGKLTWKPKNGGFGRLEDDIPFQLGWVFKIRANLKDPKLRVIFKNNVSFCISLCPKHHVRLSHMTSCHSITHHQNQSPAPARGSREGSPISAKRAKVMTKTFHKAALTSKAARISDTGIFQPKVMFIAVPETNIFAENSPSQETIVFQPCSHAGAKNVSLEGYIDLRHLESWIDNS